VVALLAVCRAVVAVTFLLSAVWKLRNRADFGTVLASAFPALSWKRGAWLGPTVGTLEIVISASLVAFSQSWIPAFAAIAFLIIFSIFLARAKSLANGCGCWRPVRRGHTGAAPYLVRNTILIVLAAAGAAQGDAMTIGSQTAVVAIALLPAWLIMEVPTIVDLLRQAGNERLTASIGGRQ
jgi:hypothetical protein